MLASEPKPSNQNPLNRRQRITCLNRLGEM
jgi:hypothetical protein